MSKTLCNRLYVVYSTISIVWLCISIHQTLACVHLSLGKYDFEMHCYRTVLCIDLKYLFSGCMERGNRLGCNYLRTATVTSKRELKSCNLPWQLKCMRWSTNWKSHLLLKLSINIFLYTHSIRITYMRCNLKSQLIFQFT